MMREIDVIIIKEKIITLLKEANFELPEDVLDAIERARELEVSEGGKEILTQIKENARRAKTKPLPLCQDCGLVNIFLEIGQEVHLTGGNIEEAVNQAVREAYEEFYLRKSMVASPIDRKNTTDNTPAVIHYNIIPGDKIRLTVMPKGGGCENMSYLKMLTPGDGIKGIKEFVVRSVSESGANPCPPIVIGLGIGGNFEFSAVLAKKALLRKLGTTNADPKLERLEKELLTAINELGIGPMGFGGTTTALAVHILEAPCHIASLPVAINIECHSHRHKKVEI